MKNISLAVVLIVGAVTIASCSGGGSLSGGGSGVWVPLRLGVSCDQAFSGSYYGSSFDDLAEAGCRGIGKSYSGKRQCRDGQPWIRCS